MNSSNGTSDQQLLQREFWAAFGDYLRRHESFLTTQKPPARNWIEFYLGRTGFSLVALVSMRDRHVAIKLVIKAPQAKGLFRALYNVRVDIESELGFEVLWREMPRRKISVISVFHPYLDPGNRNEWDVIFPWFHSKLEAFHNTFASRLKNLQPSKDA